MNYFKISMFFKTSLKLFLPSNSENMYAKWRLKPKFWGSHYEGYSL